MIMRPSPVNQYKIVHVLAGPRVGLNLTQSERLAICQMDTYVTTNEVTLNGDFLALTNLRPGHSQWTRGVVREAVVVSYPHMGSRNSRTCII